MLVKSAAILMHIELHTAHANICIKMEEWLMSCIGKFATELKHFPLHESHQQWFWTLSMAI